MKRRYGMPPTVAGTAWLPRDQRAALALEFLEQGLCTREQAWAILEGRSSKDPNDLMKALL